jgi:hypothetical protein
VLQAPATNDHGTTLTAGSGPYTLIAGNGPDTLNGGSGPDTFEFPVLPAHAGVINNFLPGIDHLDLTPLITAAHYHGTNPIADHYITFAGDNHGGTNVWFNPHNGSHHAYLITDLHGVAPSSLIPSHDLIW